MLHRIAPRHTLMICCLLSSLLVIPTMAQEGPRRGNDRGPESRRRDERDVRERTDRASEGRGRQARSRSEQPGNSREYHLRSAIRHLRAAGLGDEAERLERSVRQHRGQDTARTRDRGPSDRTQNQNRPNRPHGHIDETVRQLQQAMEQLNQRVRSTEQLHRAVDLAHQQLDELRNKAAAHTEELERHVGHRIEDLERSTNQRLEDFEREILGIMKNMEIESIRRLEDFERETVEHWHDLHEHEDEEHEDEDDEEED